MAFLRSKFVFALVLAFSLGSAARANDEACFDWLFRSLEPNSAAAAFKINVKEGTLIEGNRLRSLLPEVPVGEYEILRLGHGNGGQVFRIRPKDLKQAPYVMKAIPLNKALHDYASFELVREAAKDQNFVKIVAAEILPTSHGAFQKVDADAFMKLSDVRGESLFSVLARPDLPAPVRQSLENKYNQFLMHVSKNLKAKGMEIHIDFPDARFYIAEVSEKTPASALRRIMLRQPRGMLAEILTKEIITPGSAVFKKFDQLSNGWAEAFIKKDRVLKSFIKSDNLIVTEKFDLVLIDPH